MANENTHTVQSIEEQISNQKQKEIDWISKAFTASYLAASLSGYIQGSQAGRDPKDQIAAFEYLIEQHTVFPISTSADWVKQWKEKIETLKTEMK